MFLLTDTTLQKTGASSGYYILAWLPIAIIIIFAVRGITRKKEQK